MRGNTYSRRWFTTFLGRIERPIVQREVQFLQRQLGRATRVLDLCCGPGRHAGSLADLGYAVVGLDFDAAALDDAAVRAPGCRFVRGDMRSLPLADASVDGVICMWQSFGHFDDAMNRHVLGEMARVLRHGGRLVLDVYHREFHAPRVGERVIERDGVRAREIRSMRGDRLTARLCYEPEGGEDEFEWRLYTPNELASLVTSLGFRTELACAEFDEALPASAEHPRMQLVFERA